MSQNTGTRLNASLLSSNTVIARSMPLSMSALPGTKPALCSKRTAAAVNPGPYSSDLRNSSITEMAASIGRFIQSNTCTSSLECPPKTSAIADRLFINVAITCWRSATNSVSL
ncbi:Uncharacterised protein [Mycobacteroides abscessus subsp. abscessus]|nr:Uncharacterised protein [Mycobacteroides abscessus subsp. abscessus]